MRVIITVLGKDKPGIIAKVSTALFLVGANILDISQTVLRDEVFAMTMLAEMSSSEFPTLKEKFSETEQEMNLEIKLQREEIFNSMHRI